MFSWLPLYGYLRFLGHLTILRKITCGEIGPEREPRFPVLGHFPAL